MDIVRYCIESSIGGTPRYLLSQLFGPSEYNVRTAVYVVYFYNIILTCTYRGRQC